MPERFPAAAVKTALFPAGSAERFALREAMTSPSGSAHVTVNASGEASATLTVVGDVTDGGESEDRTVIAVTAEPDSALEALKVTL